MSATQIFTFQDMAEYVWDTINPATKPPTGRELRTAKHAIITVYRDVANIHNWAYYNRRTTLRTDAQYVTGTVTYDHCVTEEHEALTPQGWKRNNELRIGNTILAYDHVSGVCRWEQIQDIHRSVYDGDLLEVTRRGRCILRCTKNHRFPVFKRVGHYTHRRIENAGFVTSKELTLEHRVPICAPVECPERSALSPRLAAILGWAITDGTGLLDRDHDYGASIIQSTTANPENCASIAALTGTQQRGPYAQSCASWSIPASIAKQIRSVIVRTADLPWFVTRLSRDAAQAMFDAMLAAEGSCTSAGRLCFTQWHEKRKPIAEAFQILAIMVGRTANLCERSYAAGTRYQVTVRTSKTFMPGKLSSWVHFKGLVWCPQVPSGAWVCRCNGAVTITGNSGGTYERMLTTTGTWPANAARGTVVIASNHYDVEERKSDTVITLSVNSNPGADVAAGTAYVWYRESYPLPVNFIDIKAIMESGGNHNALEHVDPSSHLYLSRSIGTSVGQPERYTIRNDGDYLGAMSLIFEPASDAARTYDVLYKISPRPLQTYKYATGTVAVTAGSMTVTGSSTVFSAFHVGSIIRFTESTTLEPTSVAGNIDGTTNPFIAQRMVMSVTDTTHLVIDAEVSPTTNISGAKYVISDPIDVEPIVMRTYFECLSEYHYLRLTKRKEQAESYSVANRELLLAMTADSRSKQMQAVSSDAGLFSVWGDVAVT